METAAYFIYMRKIDINTFKGGWYNIANGFMGQV